MENENFDKCIKPANIYRDNLEKKENNKKRIKNEDPYNSTMFKASIHWMIQNFYF